MQINKSVLFIILTIINLHILAASAETPVELHGALSVEKSKIIDKNGNPVQLL